MVEIKCDNIHWQKQSKIDLDKRCLIPRQEIELWPWLARLLLYQPLGLSADMWWPIGKGFLSEWQWSTKKTEQEETAGDRERQLETERRRSTTCKRKHTLIFSSFHLTGSETEHLLSPQDGDHLITPLPLL